MRRARTALTCALWALTLLPLAARAHGDDELVLEALTAELARAPDAETYLRRAELLRHLQQWSRAEADYIAAARLAPQLASVDFFRARAIMESGSPARARAFADRFVAASPDAAEGWFLRGDI